MDSQARFEALDELMSQKLDAFREQANVHKYLFASRSPSEHAPDWNQTDGWCEVSIPHYWASAQYEALFSREIVVPESIEGVETDGSSMELEVVLPLGGAFYVDGSPVAVEESWIDSRAVPIILSEHVCAGQRHHLGICTRKSDGFGLFLRSRLRYSRVAEVVFQLNLVRQQLIFARHLVERSVDCRAEWKKLLDKAVETLSASALERNDWDEWQNSAARALRLLEPLRDASKEHRVHLVGHAHIDMNWLWRWPETLDVGRRDFSVVNDLMDKYPSFCFSQSQAALYKSVQQHYPDLFELVKRRISQKRWEVTAGTWVEGDLNMASGESLVRQLLYAGRYTERELGVRSDVCWEPDTFGHCASYPQILKKSGVKYYYFCRVGGDKPLFWWEGIDGSRILAINDVRGYSGKNEPDKITSVAVDADERYGLKAALWVYGVGDHGGAATARDIENAMRIDSAPLVPQAKLSTFAQYVNEISSHSDRLPIVKGELNTVFEGCYSSHGDIKKLNRRGESLLQSAEALSACAAMEGLASYPAEQYRNAWERLCFHQFHDIMCGCAIGASYADAREELGKVFESIEQIAGATLRTVADQLAGSPGTRVTVFNPLGWERDDPVSVTLKGEGNGTDRTVVLRDEEGTSYPGQIIGDELVFVATRVPAMGFKTYYVDFDSVWEHDPEIDASADGHWLENQYFKLLVHPKSGFVGILYDKEHDRHVTDPITTTSLERTHTAGELNRLQIHYEKPCSMSAWNLGEVGTVESLISGASTRVLESGPVRAVIEVRRKILNSDMVQRIVVYRGIRRIDFETSIDWRERGSREEGAPMLKTAFTAALGYPEAFFEIPFAGLERPANGKEVPAQRWIDVSEKDYGLSLLNDGKYGHQVKGNTMVLTLLRSSYEPDPEADVRYHEFTYSLFPHAGTWEQAGTANMAAGLNQKLLAVVTERSDGRLLPGVPAVSCQPGGVLISSVKLGEDQPEDGVSLIVRVYEAWGRPVKASLEWAWKADVVHEVDLMERPVTAVGEDCKRVEFEIGKHEIKTFGIYCSAKQLDGESGYSQASPVSKHEPL